MGWNGSNSGTQVSTPNRSAQTSRRKDKGKLRGVLAGLIIVAAGGAAIWWFFAGRDTAPEVKPSTPAKSQKMMDAAPCTTSNIATPDADLPPAKPKKVDPKARPTEVGEVVNGYVKLPSGRLHRRLGVITNATAATSKPWYQVFKYRCNNQIATYLSITPGDTLVGSLEYTGKFRDDFLDSIKVPIVVKADDPPEVAQLKKDIIQARLELKQALDRGEDIEQIMIDTHNQLQDLKRVKGSVEMLFRDAVQKCETEEDVDDLIAASNKLLAEKGIAPLECNGITKLNILRELREAHEAAIEDGVPVEQQQPATVTEGSEQQEGTEE